MKEENLVPKVRFRGFSDPWEQRKLSSMATIQGGGTPSSSNAEYWNGEINWFTPTEVFNQGYLFKSQRRITTLGLEKSSAKILPVGTILFTSRAGVGDMGILTESAATNQGFQSIIPNEDVPSYFIFTLQPFISKQANRLASGSTFTEISNKSVGKIQIDVPQKLTEKRVIGQLFLRIDELIAANEDKLDQLKELKKLMMQKIFSQEWRFKGFTDPWEQRKLKRLADLIKDGTHGTHIEHSGAFLLSAKNILSNDVIFDESDRQISIRDYKQIYRNYTLNNGDFLLTIVGTIGRTAIYQESKSKIAFQRSVAIIRGKKGVISNQFLMFTFQLAEMKNTLRRITSVSAQPGVYLGDLSNIRVRYPEIQEQQEITCLLQNLSNLIAANEEKLEQLKQLKKYLMQNMFV